MELWAGRSSNITLLLWCLWTLTPKANRHSRLKWWGKHDVPDNKGLFKFFFFFLIVLLTCLSSFSLLFSLAEFEGLPVELERLWASGPEGRARGDTSGGCTLLRILEQRRRQWVSSRRPRACRWPVRAATMRSSSWGRCSVWISM